MFKPETTGEVEGHVRYFSSRFISALWTGIEFQPQGCALGGRTLKQPIQALLCLRIICLPFGAAEGCSHCFLSTREIISVSLSRLYQLLLRSACIFVHQLLKLC